MTYLLKNYLLLRFNPDYFCRVSLQNNSLFLNLKAMSSLRNSIKKADPAPEKKEEIMLNLNLLFELANQQNVITSRRRLQTISAQPGLSKTLPFRYPYHCRHLGNEGLL